MNSVAPASISSSRRQFGKCPEESRPSRTYTASDATTSARRMLTLLKTEASSALYTQGKQTYKLQPALGPVGDYAAFMNVDSFAEAPVAGQVDPQLLKFASHREVAEAISREGWMPILILENDHVYLGALRSDQSKAVGHPNHRAYDEAA